MADKSSLDVLTGDLGLDPIEAASPPAAVATPQTSHDVLYGDLGLDAKDINAPELTERQRDIITRWGLDTRKFTRQNAPIETAEGLRDPQTGELVVGGRLEKARHENEWGPAQAFANGALQGLGPKLQAFTASMQPGAPADAYDQAKAHYETERANYNAARPLTGTGAEIGGALTTGIPATLLGAEAVGAGGALAARAAPRAEPAINFLTGAGGQGLARSANPITRFVASPVTRAASLATAGSEVGAGNAILSQNLSDEPLSDQVRQGAEWGAGLGVGIPAAWAGLRTSGSAVKAAAEPFYQSGRDAIVNRLLYEHAGPQTSPLAQVYGSHELVPGSVPTLAQAEANPGLSALERAVRNAPEGANRPFVERDFQNNMARDAALREMEGDQLSLEAARTERDQATRPLRMRALQNAPDTDAAPVVGLIDKILQSPSGQRDDVVSNLGKLRKKLVTGTTTDAVGNPVEVYQNDPRQLYGIRKSIGDLLERTNTSDAGKSAQVATRELMAVKGGIDRAITKVAPDFDKYLQTYAEMSKPIDAQELLQKMNFRTASGNVTPGLMNRATNQIGDMRVARGVNQAKSLDPEQVATLRNIRDDVVRSENTQLGAARGSPTWQNMASANALAEAGLPVGVLGGLYSHNPLIAALGYGVKKAYSAQDSVLRDQLIQSLLNPNTAIQTPARVLNPAMPVNRLIPYTVPVSAHVNKLLAPPAVNEAP